MLRYLFGNDVFISYSRRDGQAYAKRLKEQLTSMDYSCFIDYEKVYPGDHLSTALQRAIRRSKVFVLVGTEGARGSQYVRQEIVEFARTERTLIPINVGGAFAGGPWEAIEGKELVWINEPSADAPSSIVYDEIQRLFKFNRRNVWVRGVISAAATVLLVVSIVAGWQGWVAKANQKRAEEQTTLAREQTRKAEEQTGRLQKEQQKVLEQTAELETRRRELEDANRVLEDKTKELLEKTEEAERQKRAAQEQTRLARENAARAQKQEELAKERQKEANAQVVASYARSLLTTDPELSALLALRSSDMRPSRQAEDALRQALIASHSRAILTDDRLPVAYDYIDPNRRVQSTFSPGGRWVLTSDKEAVKLWRAATGELVTKLRENSAASNPPALAFSPDGRRFLLCENSLGKAVQLWDWDESAGPSNQRELRVKGEDESIESAAFSPDGKTVATAQSGNSKSVRLWDADAGRVRAELLHEDYVSDAGFSPDGSFVYTLGWRAAGAETERVVWLWDARDASKPLRQFVTGKDVTADLALSAAGGTRLLAAGDGGRAYVWNLDTGERVHALDAHDGAVNALRFSRDGKLLLTAGADGAARVWELSSGKAVATLDGHAAGVNDASFSPDSKLLVTASDDGTARIWDASTRRTLVELLGHAGPVRWASFDPSGSLVVTASADGTSRVWDADTGHRHAELRPEGMEMLWSAFAPDGRSVLAAGSKVRRWEAAGRLLSESAVEPGHVAVSAGLDGALLLLSKGSTQGTELKVWDTRGAKVVSTLRGREGLLRRAALAPGGERVAAGYDDGFLLVWDARTGAELKTLDMCGGAKGCINGFGFSPDGRFLTTTAWTEGAGAGSAIRVFDVRDWRTIATLGHSHPYSAALNHDGTRAVTIGGEPHTNTPKVWDVSRQEPLFDLKRTSVPRVNSAAFSPDGKLIATAVDDGTVEVFDAATGESITLLRVGKQGAGSPSFSPDGKFLMVHHDGKLRLFPRETFLPFGELKRLAQERLSRSKLSTEEEAVYLPASEPGK